MKRYYWSGDAVVALLLRAKNYDFLLRLLSKGGPIYTGTSTVAEFRHAVAEAAIQGRLRTGGARTLRAYFQKAVAQERIVLVTEDAASSEDELDHPVTLKNLPRLRPNILTHLAAAQKDRFVDFVTCDKHAARLCPVWGLRAVTPATEEKKEATATYEDRLRHCRYLFAQVNHYVSELRRECEEAACAAEGVKGAGVGPGQEPQSQLTHDYETARQDFMAELEQIEGAASDEVSDAEEALRKWEEATEEMTTANREG
jgi:hypothetical protein